VVTVRLLRRGLVAVLVLVVAMACSRGPKAAASLMYEVSYADVSAGEADVSYTESDGITQTVHVNIPWSSGPVHVRAGQSYRLTATAPITGKYLSCDMHLDTGWTAGGSGPGDCNYTFPDDVNK